jgi:hypothetical protein
MHKKVNLEDYFSSTSKIKDKIKQTFGIPDAKSEKVMVYFDICHVMLHSEFLSGAQSIQ